MSIEPQIRAVVDERVEAIRNKDSETLMRQHAENVVCYDVIDPLRNTGAHAVKNRGKTWFSSFIDPIHYEIAELSITAREEVAFCHYLSHVQATSSNGGEIDMWWRTTLCLEYQNGRWLITHEHDSVPMNAQTGQASVGLQP